jgi:hypothetical protein
MLRCPIGIFISNLAGFGRRLGTHRVMSMPFIVDDIEYANQSVA